jgi:hypothetical protein
MPLQTSLTGVAGEHHVLSELLRRGYIAALAPAGVPIADIVVTNKNATRQCAIQVKTRRGVGADGGWIRYALGPQARSFGLRFESDS